MSDRHKTDRQTKHTSRLLPISPTEYVLLCGWIDRCDINDKDKGQTKVEKIKNSLA